MTIHFTIISFQHTYREDLVVGLRKSEVDRDGYRFKVLEHAAAIEANMKKRPFVKVRIDKSVPQLKSGPPGANPSNPMNPGPVNPGMKRSHGESQQFFGKMIGVRLSQNSRTLLIKIVHTNQIVH